MDFVLLNFKTVSIFCEVCLFVFINTYTKIFHIDQNSAAV